MRPRQPRASAGGERRRPAIVRLYEYAAELLEKDVSGKRGADAEVSGSLMRTMFELMEVYGRFDAVATIDGSREGADGDKSVTAAAVVCAADGRRACISMRLDPKEGQRDVYDGELVGRLLALKQTSEWGLRRVLVVFDSQAPVLASRKFRQRCVGTP